ncbi:MAG: APC family permease [Candidatus Dormibacteraeota bacterium]|nr:APC family permease [Candidatus Dormibacteraeota bacterium]
MAVVEQGARSRPVGERRLRREVGLVGLLFASVGSIIGSGWLFGALNASKIAGPAALISWVIGGAAVILLALIHAELGGMYPVAGGSARFPHYAFGSLIGFSSGWFAFLGAVTTAPIEVEAALTYAGGYVSQYLHVDLIDKQGLVTAAGFAVAVVLMLIFSAINVMGVKWLSETNKIAVWWKIAIPVLAVIVLLIVAFHPGNFTAGGGFMPFGLKGVLTAIPAGGVIFAYLGFEQAIQLGAETKNPKRNIPLAVIGSMILGVILYLGLDLAFVGALDPKLLAKGWDKIAFNGTFGPFAAIFETLGLTFFAVLIYIDAVISPGGTGLLYVGTSSRLTFALGRNRYIPDIFARLSTRGVPIFAIAFSFIVGIFLFLPFPSWAQLVGFISSATVIAYAMAPLAMGALRMQEPDRERPFKLWGGSVLAPLGFIVANEIILFSGWAVVWKLVFAIVIGFILLAIASATTSAERRPSLDWRSGAWVWPYVLGLGVISYYASFGPADRLPIILLKGAKGDLPYGIDVLVMAIFSLAIYFLAMWLRLPSERVHEYVGDLAAEAEEEAEVLGPAPAAH